MEILSRDTTDLKSTTSLRDTTDLRSATSLKDITITIPLNEDNRLPFEGRANSIVSSSPFIANTTNSSTPFSPLSGLSTINNNNTLQPPQSTRCMSLKPSVRKGYWTKEFALELLEFADLCDQYARQCDSSSIRKGKSNTVLNTVSIIGCSIVLVSTWVGMIDTKALYIVPSIFVIVSNVTNGLLGLERGHICEGIAGTRLRDISQKIHVQLSRQSESRWDKPYEELIKLEDELYNILKDINIFDDDMKDKFKNARKARFTAE